MADEEQVLEALIALVDPPSTVPVGKAGELATPYPPDFLTVYVVRRGGGTGRGGRNATQGWAAYFTGASLTSGDNARKSLKVVADTLENRVLTVGAERSTPVTFDNARPITNDKGWHSGVSVYHFAI